MLPTRDELKFWFGATGYGIAVITGHRGLVIVDWDDMRKCSRWLSSLNGAALPVLSTYHVETSRGYHFYFFCDEECRMWKGDGVDVKASGGYCLCPPSIHPSGHHYQNIGNISDIERIDSLLSLLPEYGRIEWEPQIATLSPHSGDPYRDAMIDTPPSGLSIEEAKRLVSFEELLPSLSRNRGTRSALCPFHNDSTPSLVVYPDGHWFCYACGAHGRDALDMFAMKRKFSISEAIRELARTFSIL